jgi:hypothetical protein
LKLTTYLYLVPRSRKRGAISPLPQYTFMAWCSVKTPGQRRCQWSIYNCKEHVCEVCVREFGGHVPLCNRGLEYCSNSVLSSEFLKSISSSLFLANSPYNLNASV